MKPYPNIDYAYRPATYWSDSDPLHSILRHVKGEIRRQLILDHAAEGRLDELDDDLLKDELDPSVRQAWGQIHPALMGGEYLPETLPGETEIARITLRSTTGDVIALRARPTASGKIAYRVVDEYDERFRLPIQESDEPLTLAELIRQFDEGTMADIGFPDGGLSLGYNNGNARSGRYEESRYFTKISSMLYRKLHSHYENVFADWVTASVATRDATRV